jgi:hypothetical protein
MSLCLDEVTHKYGKQHYKYQEATIEATKLWRALTPAHVLVSVVTKNDTFESHSTIKNLRRSGAEIRRVRPDSSGVGCVTTSQTERMYAFESPLISPEDFVVTSDVDAFPISHRVLDPLNDTSLQVWVWQHIFAEQTGERFPMALIGMRSSLWKNTVGTRSLKEWIEYMQKTDVVTYLKEQNPWGLDQQLVTRAILDNKLCNVKVRPDGQSAWKASRLQPEYWEDGTKCFHGKLEHRHTDAGGKYWKHLDMHYEHPRRVAEAIVQKIVAKGGSFGFKKAWDVFNGTVSSLPPAPLQVGLREPPAS